MRFHAIILPLMVTISAVSIDIATGFFIKNNNKDEVISKLASVKSDLVTDVKQAIGDLKQGTYLKIQGVAGGIKAIGKAKLGFFKGIKDGKIQLIKGIAGDKLAKFESIKNGLFQQQQQQENPDQDSSSRLLLDQVVSFVETGQNRIITDGNSNRQSTVGIIFPQQSTGIRTDGQTNSGITTLLFNLFGNFLRNSESSKDSTRSSSDSSFSLARDKHSNSNVANVALFPTPADTNLPMTAHINIVTYKNQVLTPGTATSTSSSANLQQDHHHEDSSSLATSSATTSYEVPIV